MGKKNRGAVQETFARVAAKASAATGSFWAFSAALILILVWAVSGPLFGFSETWQLVINTTTTIITFLMVFIIQHAQNKENRALQLKLDELIAAVEGASNRLIDVEDLSDRELEELYKRYQHLAKTATKLTPGARTSVEAERAEGSKERVRSKKSA
ncbi:MAG TPA: low affinity iron permease family protein [Kofleriaceae bacterium]|nr:low affinity iron permease family protein [Kofleriaceae bacterium]